VIFYHYYRADRTDKDTRYFCREHIQAKAGTRNFAFEIDTRFSTYYDYKIAGILAGDLLYTYLTEKLNPNNSIKEALPTDGTKLFWTGTKNELTELIYALYASMCISRGKVGIRKLAMVFQTLFKMQLGDLHNAFHRMKYRTDRQTLFLDQLKLCMEHYMNKDLLTT
jgi:hypothetical protein